MKTTHPQTMLFGTLAAATLFTAVQPVRAATAPAQTPLLISTNQALVTNQAQVTIGAARFTVITPICVRLEYAPHNGSVDDATLFAAQRQVRAQGVKITRTAQGVVLDTGKMRLTYTPDGQPFSKNNLAVSFGTGRNGMGQGGNGQTGTGRVGTWQPGQTSTGNLGGPLATLDFLSGPVNLPNGLLSRDGWALVDDSGRPLRVNGWIAPRPGGGPPSTDIADKNQDTDWYLFAYGDDYQAALRSLSALSGRSALPRKEVLGSWYCRFYPYSSTQFRDLVKGYEEHDFPLDIMVMDMDWHTREGTSRHLYAGDPGWTGYTWNRKLLPDAEKLIGEFRDQGIFVTLNDHPHDGVRDHEETYPQFMRELGLPPAKGNFPDFNAGDKRYMDAFFNAAHGPKEQAGVDFWWLDWQQDGLFPYVTGVPGLRHLSWLNELYYQDSQKNGLRGQIYSRWGGWGDQRHPMQFSGDTHGNWDMLAFEVPFSTVSGNAGCFYWAHDTGGFFSDRNAERYVRWTQFSGMSAALRVHSVGDDSDRRPWLWGKEAEDAMRTTYHLRSQLFPYIYTSARQCYDDTLPLLRPLYLQQPQQEQSYHYPGEYQYGDNLLVAPITTPALGGTGVAKQAVYFPPTSGGWYNFFTGEAFTGGSEALVTATLDEFPLYVRGGVPLPMQPYTPRMTTALLTQLRVRCYPGADGVRGSATLYEDDGRTQNYAQGGSARTPLSYLRRGDTVTIGVGAAQGRYTGQTPQRSVIVELPSTTRATRVTVGGKTLPSQYDAATGTNTIAVPARSLSQPLSLTVRCAPLAANVMSQRALARRTQAIAGRPLTTLPALRDVPEAKREALLAAFGIGLMKRREGPNYQANQNQYNFYAPAGMVDGNRVTVADRESAGTVRALNGKPLALNDPRIAHSAPTVLFNVGGTPVRLGSGDTQLFGPDNAALSARLTASSSEDGRAPDGATDGVAGGYPSDPGAEWASTEKVGATLRLNWATPQRINAVELFDRPNDADHVTSGVITFSDGSTVNVGELSKSQQGTRVAFAPKTVTWLTFKVTGVGDRTFHAGLAEIVVRKAP